MVEIAISRDNTEHLAVVSHAWSPKLLRGIFVEQTKRPMGETSIERLTTINGHLFSDGLAPVVPTCSGEKE